jgi:hypothetical protein
MLVLLPPRVKYEVYTYSAIMIALRDGVTPANWRELVCDE